MKRTISQFLSSRQGKLFPGLPFHWGGGELILAAILIFGILSLGSGMVGKWIDSASDSWLDSVTLHSFAEANYGVDEIIRSIPEIGLDIIRDLLGINAAPGTGGLPETVLLTPGAPTPTPTQIIPFSGFPPGTFTATEINPDNPTATNNSPASSTPSLERTATPTSSPAAQSTLPPTSTSNSPLVTNTPRHTSTQGSSKTNTPVPTSFPGNNSTSTPIPTSTPRKISTNTQVSTSSPGNSVTNTPQPTEVPPAETDQPQPTNPPQPPPTNPPNPSPTPKPATSPTARPTRSSTLAVTPIAEYTPGVTDGPPTSP